MENIKHICNIQKFSFSELSEIGQNLIHEAMNATNNAYAPYSKFCVGAAGLLDNGTICIGANQENAAYPSGLCAERTVIFAANAQHPNNKIIALAIAAKNADGFTKIPVGPCGACRQVILEVESRYQQPIKIFLYGEDCIYVVDSITEILPLQFTSSSL